MKATGFEQSNAVLGPPPGVQAGQCANLPVHVQRETAPRAGPFIVTSCWELSEAERAEVFATGRIWLHVWSGAPTQPPVSLSVVSPFEPQAGETED